MIDNIVSRITLYHNLYFACLVATVIFIVISIVLFICLDMKYVIGFLTGSQAKREIQRLETERAIRKEENSSVKLRKVDDIPKVTITRKLEENSPKKTEYLNAPKEQSFQTTLLQDESAGFYIECEIMLIHTNEIIE